MYRVASFVFIIFSFATPVRAQGDKILSKVKNDSVYAGIIPIVGGIIPISKGTGVATSLELGARLSLMKKFGSFSFGATVAYQHLFLAGYKDPDVLRPGIFAEYAFLRQTRSDWRLGLRPYLFQMWYTPRLPAFQFFDDKQDGRATFHNIPAFWLYLGYNLHFRGDRQLLFQIGYDQKLSDKSGIYPGGKNGFNVSFDFRFPLKW